MNEEVKETKQNNQREYHGNQKMFIDNWTCYAGNDNFFPFKTKRRKKMNASKFYSI